MPKKISLVRILGIQHRDRSGRVIFEGKDLSNVVHSSGEEYMLKVLFSGQSVPAFYYIGLDARPAPSAPDTIEGLQALEPNSNGYERQSLNSGDFATSLNASGTWQSTGPTVLFQASGGSWGPIKNIFLCTGLGYESPTLISSVSIGQNLTVQDGETVTMRMAMSLSGC